MVEPGAEQAGGGRTDRLGVGSSHALVESKGPARETADVERDNPLYAGCGETLRSARPV